VVWFNAESGVVSAWLLNGTRIVQGKQDLDWTCGAGCSNMWSPIGIGDLNYDGHMDVVWFNAQTGVVSAWLLNGTRNVQARQDLDWTCGAGCSNMWKPIGIGDLNADYRPDVVWFNAQTGVVSAWLLNGTRIVQGKQDLDWTCGAGCSDMWSPIGIGGLA